MTPAAYLENAVAVLVGGAVGAACRFTLADAVATAKPMAFPLGILCINVLGGLLMGLLKGGIERTGNPHKALYSLLGTGFLGGFTTFSTFSLDTFNLYQAGAFELAGLNIGLNTVICICAAWLGYRLLEPKAA